MECKDEIIVCKNCGQQFVWTRDEQEYYQKQGAEKPSLCLICRSLNRFAAADNFRGKSQFEK